MKKALNFIWLFAQDSKNHEKYLSLTFMETLKLLNTKKIQEHKNTICRCAYKLSTKWFAQALVRFAKQLSFRYLKNTFVSCLSSALETPLRCLWDVFLKCRINAFVRQRLNLQKSCLLDILKTSPQDVLLSSQDS